MRHIAARNPDCHLQSFCVHYLLFLCPFAVISHLFEVVSHFSLVLLHLLVPLGLLGLILHLFVVVLCLFVVISLFIWGCFTFLCYTSVSFCIFLACLWQSHVSMCSFNISLRLFHVSLEVLLRHLTHDGGYFVCFCGLFCLFVVALEKLWDCMVMFWVFRLLLTFLLLLFCVLYSLNV